MRCVYRRLIAAAVILFAGCQIYTPAERQKEEEESTQAPHMKQADDLFISGGMEGNLERTIFRTNDKQRHWSHEGMTMWTVRGEAEGAFTSRTVTMGKPAGYSGGGYGVVFCHGEYKINEIQTPVMLVVMINNDGCYIIGKAVGGVFTDYGWWKYTSSLRRGSGASNEIKISYEEKNGDYRLEINGDYVESFRDNEKPALRGGRNGYIVVITPFDKFPEYGIDVYFMEER